MPLLRVESCEDEARVTQSHYGMSNFWVFLVLAVVELRSTSLLSTGGWRRKDATFLLHRWRGRGDRTLRMTKRRPGHLGRETKHRV